MSYGDFSSPQAQYMLEISGNLSNGVDAIEHKFYISCIATVVVRNDWRYIMGENEVEHENLEEEYREMILNLLDKMDLNKLKFYYRFISGMEKERD